MKNPRFSVISKSDKVSLVSIVLLSIFIIVIETPIVARNAPNVAFYGLMAVLLLLNINVFMKTSKQNKLILLVTAAYVVLFTVYIDIFSAAKKLVSFVYVMFVSFFVDDGLSVIQEMLVFRVSGHGLPPAFREMMIKR